MKKIHHILFCMSIVALLLMPVFFVEAKQVLDIASSSSSQKNKSSVVLNQDVIESISKHDIDINNPLHVFRAVFASLPSEATIYPSENYFYFKLSIDGKVFGGALHLPPDAREKGELRFGYIERAERAGTAPLENPSGVGVVLGVKDGVKVKKIDDWTYTITFEHKTVLFHLYHRGMASPKRAKLLPDEVFVGPSFDESGLQFFLIFNKKTSHLSLVLDEDEYVPESFAYIAKDIVIGRRTEFAFYLDKANNRKVLIGARGENVMNNNWYDGPFDQMPDNYIATGQIPRYQEYLEAAYQMPRGTIDQFGHFLGKKDTRIAVGPYRVYWTRDELKKLVTACERKKNNPSIFSSCITKQDYSPPPQEKQNSCVEFGTITICL